MRAYLTLRYPDGKRLGAVSLERVLTVEAPGIGNRRYNVRPYSHIGFPVLLVEERYAFRFRETYQKVRGAVEACGYQIAVELTAEARRAL